MLDAVQYAAFASALAWHTNEDAPSTPLLWQTEISWVKPDGENFLSHSVAPAGKSLGRHAARDGARRGGSRVSRLTEGRFGGSTFEDRKIVVE
jgi:hypothetical protein